MENLPDPSPDKIRLVSIDPGTDTMGVAILDIDGTTLDYEIVYAHTFKASKITEYGTSYDNSFGHACTRLASHRNTLTEIFQYTSPTLCCAESMFLKMGRVNAYEALLKSFTMLLEVVWNYSPSMYLYRIDPVSAKNYVGVSHKGTDKEDVRRGVVNHLTCKLSANVKFDDLDEHSIDAVAIGNCFVRRELHNDIVESTRKKKKRNGVKVRRKKRGRR